MPLYDFRCRECGFEFEDFAKIADRLSVRCPGCDSLCDIIPASRLRADEHIFKPYIDENISLDMKPVLIKSKAHLKELCKANGCYAPHVFGGGKWNISEI